MLMVILISVVIMFYCISNNAFYLVCMYVYNVGCVFCCHTVMYVLYGYFTVLDLLEGWGFNAPLVNDDPPLVTPKSGLGGRI